MDLFNRGKSKAKKKSDPPIIQTIPTPQYNTSSHSPKSPHPNEDYVQSGKTRVLSIDIVVFYL